ncbi:protein prune homolog 2 isoform X2 [Leptidea sinapis]|uniref:protein prune homolog 2 isoform X2 n=1 Tax=Leptidea sinapis TaxID=189913 RepID=UPI0021C287AF|nr:protein prune homolog 2 isoform X2 [Leptidea sinapis]
MNNIKEYKQSEDELVCSQSSEEKMDTGSESLNSNSNQSPDYDEQDVLRLQNPEHLEIDNSLDIGIETKISHSQKQKDLKSLKYSTLTLTTDHPLMGLGSPEKVPDLIPKRSHKTTEIDTLSSIEYERFNHTNGYEFYSPQRNTSKNNLYFSDHFVTAESHTWSESFSCTPDVARIQKERRNIVLKYLDNVNKESTVGKDEASSCDSKCDLFIQASHSTPKSAPINMPEPHSHNLGPVDWCSSPSQLRKMPNFELPIELNSSIRVHNDLESPDLLSSSREDRSAYQALLDPYTGSVALRLTTPRSPADTRRKVKLPPLDDEDDECSLDSVSGCSMNTEDEPPPPEPLDAQEPTSECEDTKRSKSTATVSEASEQIAEYSLADELRDERSWLHVRHSTGQGTCDMKVIEPFKRVISHGGYCGEAAIIVFSACHLPDNCRQDYRYVMDNLFLYVIWSLQRLVTEEYILVYLHGSGGRRRMPSFAWLHECYKLIDRRLRKNLKHLYLVHPTFWLKSFVVITKPFVSSKFFRKLSYVNSLRELLEQVPVEPNAIPDIVKYYDSHKR